MSLLDFIADNVEPGPSIPTRPAPVSPPDPPAAVAVQPIQTPTTPENSIFAPVPGGDLAGPSVGANTAPTGLEGGDLADEIPAWPDDPSPTSPATVPHLSAWEVAALDDAALWARLVLVADRRVDLEHAGRHVDSPELRQLRAEMRWACEHRPTVFDRLTIPYPVPTRPTVADDVLIFREVF